MIITKIIGGLGNQLFQYAAGKALALQHKTKLLLDINDFNEYKLRNFDLGAFQTELQFASAEQIHQFTNRNLVGKIRDNIFPMALRKVYKPKHFCFHKRFFKASSDIYLAGYWQSEKYFQPITETIRREFNLRPEHIANVQPTAQKIRNENAVAVHIRRGDYSNPVIVDIHGVLPASYYIKGISLIKQKYHDAKFYFFSDDMSWVKEKLPENDAVYVSGIATTTHLEDFYLMSQCKHNIIANSSFSWWAAWLNNNPGKTVIVPERWFNKGPKDAEDIIPSNWFRI